MIFIAPFQVPSINIFSSRKFNVCKIYKSIEVCNKVFKFMLTLAG